MEATTVAIAPLQELVADYNRLLAEGKVLEAFENYYAEDVSMQENTDEPMIGKASNRERERNMWDNVTAIRDISVRDLAFGENGVVIGVWHYDLDHSQWGAYESTQVAVQHWENGKIIKEQFFHK